MVPRRGVSTDIVNFPGRVLVIQAPRLFWNSDPDTERGSGQPVAAENSIARLALEAASDRTSVRVIK